MKYTIFWSETFVTSPHYITSLTPSGDKHVGKQTVGFWADFRDLRKRSAKNKWRDD